jgi:hypothetical protein
MTLAVDYSTGTIDPADLHDEQISAVLRYITGPDLAPKSLTRAEAEQLLAANIPIVCLWETTADRMLGGALAGHVDGAQADANLIALGAPAGVKVVFAGDFDVQPDQVGTCLDYLFAAGAALGDQHLVAAYGGLRLVAAAADAGYATIQTVGWSHDQWDPRAAARQTGEQRTIGGILCDLDEILDLGALGPWTAGGGSVSAPEIPASIVAKWPFLAKEFPPGVPYTDETATIWGDAGARAAAEYSQQAADSSQQAVELLQSLTTAVSGLAAKVDALAGGTSS